MLKQNYETIIKIDTVLQFIEPTKNLFKDTMNFVVENDESYQQFMIDEVAYANEVLQLIKKDENALIDLIKEHNINMFEDEYMVADEFGFNADKLSCSAYGHFIKNNLDKFTEKTRLHYQEGIDRDLLSEYTEFIGELIKFEFKINIKTIPIK